jgi:flagellar motor switch protein FliG
MSGVQKAAALLVAIGEQRASEIIRHLGETEVEALSLEIAKARKVPAEVCKEVVSEAVETVMAEEYIADGGVDFARSVLERSLGANRAEEIIGRLAATIERRRSSSCAARPRSRSRSSCATRRPRRSR